MTQSAKAQPRSDELERLLLPGECLSEVGHACEQVLVLTSWRLLVLEARGGWQLAHSSALCGIERLQVADALTLRVHRKFACPLPALAFDSLPDITNWADRLDPGKLPGQPAPPPDDKDCRHGDKDFEAEAERLGLSRGQWRVSSANADWQLCDSYPRLHAVPGCVSDAELLESSRYRAQGRFPSCVWRCAGSGAALARSAQPLVGLTGFLGWRCKSDEKLVAALGAGTSSKVLIVDARAYSSALGNGTRGGGYERPEYYANTEIQYLGLPNMHAVRNSFASMLAALQSGQPASAASFLVELERSGWPQLLSSLLLHAGRIAEALVLHGRSVLVHCSDGWDRTPQLVSLALLLADPHYRTVQGFRQLLQREWLEFGHKFADRCANRRRPGCRGNETDASERAPIFVQFLHCVHQLLAQAPAEFEFTDCLLRQLGRHCYSGFYRDFFANCPRQRQPSDDPGRCLCRLFELSSARNRLFVAAEAGRLLRPDARLCAVRLWRRFYVPRPGLRPIDDHCLDSHGLSADTDPQQEKLEALQQQLEQLRRRNVELRQLAEARAESQRSSTPIGSAEAASDSQSEGSAPSLELVSEREAQFTRWVPDRLRPQCAGCGSAFGVVRRRHHCRVCGEVFCHPCSDNFLPLPDPHLPNPESPVRVCNRCSKCRRTDAAPAQIRDSRIAVNS